MREYVQYSFLHLKFVLQMCGNLNYLTVRISFTPKDVAPVQSFTSSHVYTTKLLLLTDVNEDEWQTKASSYNGFIMQLASDDSRRTRRICLAKH